MQQKFSQLCHTSRITDEIPVIWKLFEFNKIGFNHSHDLIEVMCKMYVKLLSQFGLYCILLWVLWMHARCYSFIVTKLNCRSSH